MRKWLDLYKTFFCSSSLTFLLRIIFWEGTWQQVEPCYSSVKQWKHLIRATLSGALSRKTPTGLCFSTTIWAKSCIDRVIHSQIGQWVTQIKSSDGCIHSHNLGEVTYLFTRCWLHSHHMLDTVLWFEIYLRIKSPQLLPCGAYLLVKKWTFINPNWETCIDLQEKKICDFVCSFIFGKMLKIWRSVQMDTLKSVPYVNTK